MERHRHGKENQPPLNNGQTNSDATEPTTSGHYMSATAMAWASTHSKDLFAKMTSLVEALYICQNVTGTGYLSAFSDEFFDRFEAIELVWAPYYTIHKKESPLGAATESAHPARFSPDDPYSRQRVLLKRRFGLLPTQQPPLKY